MALQPNQPAPQFSLYDSEKQKISLSDYGGKKVLLLFFPFAFSSTCTKELCSVRDSIAEYSNIDAEVLGISVDSLYTLAKFKEDQKLNFKMLSDFNKEVSTAYESLYELFNYGMKGVSKRAAFVIDRQGVLQYTEVLENSGEVPNFSAILKALQSIA